MPVVFVPDSSVQAELERLSERIAAVFEDQWQALAGFRDEVPWDRTELSGVLRILLNMDVIQPGAGLGAQEVMRATV